MLIKLIRNRRGGGIIETPIAMLLLSMLFIFFSGFCFTYYNKMVMNMAVHEGAREFAVHLNRDAALTLTENELKLGGIKDATVAFDELEQKVVVTKNIGFYVPLTDGYLFHLESSAVFRKENDLNYFIKGID